ncbi:putative adhesin [Streptomyces sp. NPDC002580]|uniref:putative adhesin n=1 Tax=Streptomyces sp. NPDC002580 TaxID=3364653 RepID=UPI0036A9B135
MRTRSLLCDSRIPRRQNRRNSSRRPWLPGGRGRDIHGSRGKLGLLIPNYTLAAPTGSMGGSFSVFENSTTVVERTKIANLLQPGMVNVHWAACREIL